MDTDGYCKNKYVDILCWTMEHDRRINRPTAQPHSQTRSQLYIYSYTVRCECRSRQKSILIKI